MEADGWFVYERGRKIARDDYEDVALHNDQLPSARKPPHVRDLVLAGVGKAFPRGEEGLGTPATALRRGRGKNTRWCRGTGEEKAAGLPK